MLKPNWRLILRKRLWLRSKRGLHLSRNYRNRLKRRNLSNNNSRLSNMQRNKLKNKTRQRSTRSIRLRSSLSPLSCSMRIWIMNSTRRCKIEFSWRKISKMSNKPKNQLNLNWIWRKNKRSRSRRSWKRRQRSTRLPNMH